VVCSVSLKFFYTVHGQWAKWNKFNSFSHLIKFLAAIG